MRQHFTITIRGNLQHKGYKLRTMILANKYGIKGSVAEEEHKIIIDAEGEVKELKAFMDEINKQQAEIAMKDSTMESCPEPLCYFDEFRIL